MSSEGYYDLHNIQNVSLESIKFYTDGNDDNNPGEDFGLMTINQNGIVIDLVDIDKNILIGHGANTRAPGERTISMGYLSGQTSQAAETVAIGYQAGQTSQGFQAISLGVQSGRINQGDNSLAIGYECGYSSQGGEAIAIGNYAGRTSQGYEAIAIGYQAGNINQGSNALAIGFQTGQTGQGIYSVAIGYQSGQTSQGDNSIAIGNLSGMTEQNNQSIAIGDQAGQTSQQINCVAIGTIAGQTNQQNDAIAIGNQAGYSNQQPAGIAIGLSAGKFEQGEGSIAIGWNAGLNGQHPNTIILNAQSTSGSGTVLDSGRTGGFYVAPLNDTLEAGATGVMIYNNNTKEITYSTAKTFVINHPRATDKYLVHSCLEGPEAGIYYRGKSEIQEGETGFVEVSLPDYVASFGFDFSVQLTNIYKSGCNNSRVLSCSEVNDGRFKVYGEPGPFYWLVHASRGYINVEPMKADVEIKGDGPYKYI